MTTTAAQAYIRWAQCCHCDSTAVTEHLFFEGGRLRLEEYLHECRDCGAVSNRIDRVWDQLCELFGA